MMCILTCIPKDPMITFPSATLVEADLAKEINAKGFTGIEFVTLEEFDGM